MAPPSILIPEQLAELDARGVLRLPGLLGADRVRVAREPVQSRLARWASREGAGGRAKLRTSKVVSKKHPAVEALLDEPVLLSILQVLADGFDRAACRRPQLLVTLPGVEVPTVWHVDMPRLASGGRPGVQLFTFLDTVEPRGGGTLVIAGSHRLLNDGRAIRAKQVRQLLRRESFFRTLYCIVPATAEEHVRLLNQDGLVGDVALEVLELTGAPGDVYLTDVRVLHTAASNATDRTRLMATHRFLRDAVMRELADTYGWE